MTQDEIIEMAMQTGVTSDLVEELEAFAALVEEKATAIEREACAKVCDSFYESWINIHGRYEFMGEGAQECADAIRARGQA